MKTRLEITLKYREITYSAFFMYCQAAQAKR